jgi:Icc-related predicted phosphoesterase
MSAKTGMRGRTGPCSSGSHDDADVLCLCGDLTNYGKTGEVENLLADLRQCRIPMVGVLGNHEHECGQPDHVTQMLSHAGVKMLTGQAYEIEGVGFAGGKGFVGGFGRYMLSSFGEASIKTFVQAAVEDANLIENSIRTLRTERSVVLLHYSPVVDTVVGEPPEIHAFLGSSRLAETIDRYDNISLVVHGHAHRGAPEGRTNKGTPVYNVALSTSLAEPSTTGTRWCSLVGCKVEDRRRRRWPCRRPARRSGPSDWPS